nr:ABC transporter ATP-binding protein [uncultured Schaedlerella sp.]
MKEDRESSRQYIRFLKEYAGKRRLIPLYIFIIAFIITNTVISLIRPKLQGEIIDDLSNPDAADLPVFMASLFVFLGMLMINYIVIYCQKYTVAVISEEIAADIRQKVHDKLTTVQTEFFSHMELSDILLKVDKDAEAIKRCGITSIITLVSNIAVLIVVPPYMISIHKGIAVTNILLLISVPFVSKWLGMYIQQTSEEVLQGYNDMTNALTNSYNNWFIIRIFQCGRYAHDKYSQRNQHYRKMINRQNLLYIANTVLVLVIQFIGAAVIWIAGAGEIFAGNMTVGTILALMNYQNIIMNPILGIADFANEYHTAMASLKDIHRLLSRQDIEREGKNGIRKIRELKLDNVGFFYPGSEYMIFKNLNVTFQTGKLYAVLGKSGQGKSTLFKLLTGINQPTEGEILIGGEKMSETDLYSYWKRVGFVMQRSTFFKDSVKRNLTLNTLSDEGYALQRALGHRDQAVSQMDELSRCLDLYEEIHSLPDIWDTEIKTDPCNFSEGQMRRLDIMRNVLKDPDVLIFDEATANIDRKRRGDFYALLRTLSEHKIIVYSTHNEEELAEADEVINLAELCQ